MKVNYPIKEEYIEEIEKLAAYYRYHTVEAMNKKHPEFVEEDFKRKSGKAAAAANVYGFAGTGKLCRGGKAVCKVAGVYFDGVGYSRYVHDLVFFNESGAVELKALKSLFI